jgi:hypothetical protein
MWDGTRFLAGGAYSTNQFAYSLDGFNWTIGSGFSTIFQDDVAGIALNSDRPNRIVFPANRILAGGRATISMAYSSDGLSWTPVPNSLSIFSVAGHSFAWNGTLWVAVGQGTANSIAYSPDGINWTGLGKTIFTGANALGYCVLWVKSLSRWVAFGQTTNTIAYSPDGINWTGLGLSTFSFSARSAAWNGTRFVAVGAGTNSIAYSSDGITWTGVPGSTSIFSIGGMGVAWNGTLFVAGGNGTNSIAYSSDGITWTGLGTSIFSNNVQGIAWNGTLWVAVGVGSNSIAYSYDGINWTGLGTTIFSHGFGVGWVGNRFVAVGQGTNTIAYSSDGITWTGSGTSVFNSLGQTVGWNGGKAGVFMNPNPLVLNANGAGLSNRLDVSADGYYNTGFSNMTMTIRT